MSDLPVRTWSYRPGSWFAVFGTATTVLLPASEKARVGDLWARIDDGAGFDEVLDVLLQSGLGSLPGFALVSGGDGPTKILLRGADVRATVVADGESTDLDGASALTWVERTFTDVESLSLLVSTASPDGAESTDDLPIHGGLVRVARVDQPGVTAPEPEPDVVVRPVPESTPPPPLAAPVVEPSATAPPEEEAPVVGTPAPVDPLSDPLTDPLPDAPADPPTEQLEVESSPLDDDAADTYSTGAPVPPPPLAPPLAPPTAPPTTPPTSPPPMPLPPPPYVPPAPPEASASGDDQSVDHDGLTQAGLDPHDFARSQPGIPGQPMAPSVVAPVARLVVSSGETVEVDRVVLIGRAPEARRFTTTDQPRLVTVPSPLHEISSTHIEIRPGSGADHGSAVVTDMGSTNGTVLEQPGLGPEELKPGIAVQLIPGAVINLGDGVTIRVTHA